MQWKRNHTQRVCRKCRRIVLADRRGRFYRLGFRQPQGYHCEASGSGVHVPYGVSEGSPRRSADRKRTERD